MKEYTREELGLFLTQIGFELELDNPKEKDHYKGDMLVTIKNLEFTNSNPNKHLFYCEELYHFGIILGFSNPKEFVLMYKVLNDFQPFMLEIFNEWDEINDVWLSDGWKTIDGYEIVDINYGGQIEFTKYNKFGNAIKGFYILN